MKQFLGQALVLALMSSSAFAVTRTQDFGDKVVYEFAVEALDFESKNLDGAIFNEAHLVGVGNYAGIHHELGMPELPVIRLTVEADQASDIVVTQRNFKSFVTVDAQNIKPVVLSPAKIAGTRYHYLRQQLKKALPQSYSIKKLGSVRGQNQFLVTLYPVGYNSASETLAVQRSYAVEVNKSKSAPVRGQGLMFVVGEQFKTSASLAAYENLKKQQGFAVTRLNAGSMNPEQIRAAIQAQYNKDKKLAYVIVVGDESDVPAEEGRTISGVTDHFYACIDTADYASDILTPDLFVGRFSATNEGELAAMLKKYTLYSSGNFRSLDWLNSVSFLATDDRYTVAEGSHNYAIDTYTQKKGYTGVFPSARQAGGDKLYAITHSAGNAEVMTSLGAGRSIVDYSGHGANTYWDAPRVDQDDVRSLKSSGLPFVISNACITGDFRVDESFAETWQRHEWGAVMFWGSMDSTYWDEDDILERAMFDGIFRDNKLAFGAIAHHALKANATHYGGAGRSQYYWETYHMFGDPSMNLRIR